MTESANHYSLLTYAIVIAGLMVYQWINQRNVVAKSIKLTTSATLLNDAIQLYYIDQFMSATECAQLIEYVQDRFEASKVIDGTSTTVSPHRSSSSSYLNQAETELIADIEFRAAKLLHVPLDQLESLQIVRYSGGQQIKTHFDWFDSDFVSTYDNQRHYTILVFLSDLYQQQGGGTQFYHLNLTVQPTMGDALVWRNCHSMHEPDQKTLHAGLPPSDNTVKYGLNMFTAFHTVNYQPNRSQ